MDPPPLLCKGAGGGAWFTAKKEKERGYENAQAKEGSSTANQ